MPIRRLVERIRAETGTRVPDVDPDGPGTEGRILLVLLAPSDPGALATGVLSPTRNDDATARNMRKLLSEAELGESEVVFWNAVPWDVGNRPRPRAEDIKKGAVYLQDLVSLFDDLGAVVAMGRVAQNGCKRAGIEAIPAPIPSPLGLYGGGANRWEACRAALTEALRRAGREPARTE